ncbi:GPI mannosyltransferase 2 [Schistosoma japonicum]|nr:GPI mannosyltransferase 2 [Schistosoma japonicum]
MFGLSGIESSLLKCAFVVRLVFVLIIFISSLFPDHDADAFKPPEEPYVGWVDKAIRICFQGFCKWDSLYFAFIASYGYIFEQSLAFFPGFPMLLGLLGRVVTRICVHSLSLPSAILICGFLSNFVLSLASTVVLYRLGVLIFGSTKVNFLASLLFCCNPAVVFFSSLYSESLFFFCSVSGLYFLGIKKTVLSSLFITFSVLCRSNGLLNIGYLAYFILVRSDFRFFIWGDEVQKTRKSFTSFFYLSARWWLYVVAFVLPRLMLLCLCSLPFLLYQTYCYFLYCSRMKLSYISFESKIPESLLIYGIDNGFSIPYGFANESISPNSPTWCSFTPPFSYAFIQESKWNVGLWKYYRLRQIPNFILALPIVILCFMCSIVFYRRAPKAYRTLGLYAECEMDRTMVPYVFHMLFLCAYGVLHINVQVLTRMIFSSCPIVYWFCAYLLREVLPNFEPLMNNHSNSNIKYEFYHYVINIYKALNPLKYRLMKHRLLLFYFLGYAVIGCIMHPNFLPWT